MPMNKELKRIVMPFNWKNAVIDMDYTDLELSDIKEINTFLLENGVLFANCHCHTKIPYPSFFKSRICAVLEYYYEIE